VHHTFRVAIVFEPERVAELVYRFRQGATAELVAAVAVEASQGDDRMASTDVRKPEDEVVPMLEHVDGGHGEDTIPRFLTARAEERGSAILVSGRIERGLRDGSLGRDVDLPEIPELRLEVFEDAAIDRAEGFEGESHPFTTPSGAMRATIFVRPAPSATRTTSSTFLYAPGASSTMPALEAACR